MMVPLMVVNLVETWVKKKVGDLVALMAFRKVVLMAARKAVQKEYYLGAKPVASLDLNLVASLAVLLVVL